MSKSRKSSAGNRRFYATYALDLLATEVVILAFFIEPISHLTAKASLLVGLMCALVWVATLGISAWFNWQLQGVKKRWKYIHAVSAALAAVVGAVFAIVPSLFMNTTVSTCALAIAGIAILVLSIATWMSSNQARAYEEANFDDERKSESTK